VPIVSALFHACCPCDVQTQHVNYSHKALFLKNLDNIGEKAIESESLQFNKNAYGIRLYITREKNMVARTKQKKSIFVNLAYATSCACPPEYFYTAIDTILSIKVFTLYNFDNQHPENSEITNYFKVAQTYSDVEDYVASIPYANREYWKAGRLMYDPPEMEMKIDLMLMTVPITNSKHQFRIQVFLSDGRILEQQITEIQLL